MPCSGKSPEITGEIEARIIAIACSTPPEAQSRWTLRLLRDRVIAEGYLR